MAEMIKTGMASIVVSQNPREEIRLTLRQLNDLRFVDLRSYALDEKKGKTVPTEKGAVINLELWPLFRRAVARLEPCNGTLPVWVQQMAPNGGNRSVFPGNAPIRENAQEQIYLEHQDFRGITFILLKTSAISKRGRPCRIKRLITIGPILWSQFLQALNKMDEVLVNLGLLSDEAMRQESGLEHVPA